MAELEKGSELNKKEVEACDKNIEAWEQQIKELQAKITKVNERRDELLKHDQDKLTKEIQVGMHHVERAQKLEKEIDSLISNKYVYERRLRLQKSKYHKMKASVPF